MQQGDSNREFLSDDFSKLLKESLFFRESQVGGPFLLKLRTTTTYFELNIFHSNLKGNSMDDSTLRNLIGCYQNSNPSQKFLWGQSHL